MGAGRPRRAVRGLDRCAAPTSRPGERAALRARRQSSSRARRNPAAGRRRSFCLARAGARTPAPALAPRRAGRSHRARPRRSAAAVLLARRDLRRRRRARTGTHRRRMVARAPSLRSFPRKRESSGIPLSRGRAAKALDPRLLPRRGWRGHRFWLYREGLYGRETAAARWFVHGLFA